MKIKLHWLAAAGLAALIAGCGGGDDKESREKQMERYAKDHGIDVDVELDENGEIKQVETEMGGATLGQNVRLPSDFPKDINVAGGWNVIAVAPLPQGGYSLQALVESSSEDILSKVSKTMTGDDWTKTDEASPYPGMSKLAFEKEGRLANFTVMGTDGTKSVQLVTMAKP